MVDQATLSALMVEEQELRMPDGTDKLTPEQQVEVTKFLVSKIAASDELMKALTKKVDGLRNDKANC